MPACLRVVSGCAAHARPELSCRTVQRRAAPAARRGRAADQTAPALRGCRLPTPARTSGDAARRAGESFLRGRVHAASTTGRGRARTRADCAMERRSPPASKRRMRATEDCAMWRLKFLLSARVVAWPSSWPFGQRSDGRTRALRSHLSAWSCAPRPSSRRAPTAGPSSPARRRLRAPWRAPGSTASAWACRRTA